MKRALKVLYDFLASMKLAIFILFAIPFFIILRSVGYKLNNVFEDGAWLKTITATEYYNSPELMILSFLFCLNLLLCTLRRIPHTIKAPKKTSGKLNKNLIGSLPIVKRLTAKNQTVSIGQLATLLTAHFKKPKSIQIEKNEQYLYAEKGRSTHLSFYFAHLCIIGVVLGFMTSAHDSKYSFRITKGQVLDPLVIKDARGNKKTLDFAILCEDIMPVYYKATAKIKQYQSIITLIAHNEKIKNQMVDAEHSLKYKGFVIHQDPFMMMTVYGRIKVVSQNGETELVEITDGSKFSVNDTGLIIEVNGIESNACQLKCKISSEKVLVSNRPAKFSAPELKDYQFSLIESFKKESIVLKVSEDTGNKVNVSNVSGKIIWINFVGMFIGFIMIFLFGHQRIWATVEEKNGECIIILAGTTTKNLSGLEQLFNTIEDELINT